MQQLKALAADPAHGSAYLSGKLVGPQRSRLIAALADYTGPEAAAASMGMREVIVPYAHQASISPGTQLFALASTLFGLGMYTDLGQPNGNAEVWKNSIIL